MVSKSVYFVDLKESLKRGCFSPLLLSVRGMLNLGPSIPLSWWLAFGSYHPLSVLLWAPLGGAPISTLPGPF